MTARHRVAKLLSEALEQAERTGVLPAEAAQDPAVERPQNPEHGDFASSLPLKLARLARRSPLAIAEALVPLVPGDEAVDRVWAAPPGFVNFSLSGPWLAAQVDRIRNAGATYGDSNLGSGTSVQVEFVSGNPTGPLQVGNARGAVLGSTLANILEAAGHEVQREYYVNDAGTQIEHFNRSLYVRYLQACGREVEFPESGYPGAYLVDLAQEIRSEHGDRFLEVSEEEGISDLGELGLTKMLDTIRADVALLRVRYDAWFSERSLYRDGLHDKTIELLSVNGHLTKRDGATWLASKALGDDRDNVLVRRTGAPTYFASDIAYHYNKLVERGFDQVIDIWGSDHQGHVPRMKAAIAALGVDPNRLTMLIYQVVTLRRGDEIVKLSKRSGDIVTMRELVEEVGPDACRFFFLSRSAESQMEFDLELAKEQSVENPVYYVQYAHARIAGIVRLASERGIDFAGGDLSLLTHEAELALIRKMLVLPELIETMASTLEPHHLPHYAQELATAFHWFYQQCRVVSGVKGEEEITRARLKLVDAARTTLARCLDLMGMDAPDRM